MSGCWRLCRLDDEVFEQKQTMPPGVSASGGIFIGLLAMPLRDFVGRRDMD
jgi:hypothetical protein